MNVAGCDRLASHSRRLLAVLGELRNLDDVHALGSDVQQVSTVFCKCLF